MSEWEAVLAPDRYRFLCGWRVQGRTSCGAVLAVVPELVDAPEDGPEGRRPYSIDVAAFYLTTRSDKGYVCTIPEVVRQKLEKRQFPRGRRGIPVSAVRRYGFQQGLVPPIIIECPMDRRHGRSVIKDFPSGL